MLRCLYAEYQEWLSELSGLTPWRKAAAELYFKQHSKVLTEAQKAWQKAVEEAQAAGTVHTGDKDLRQDVAEVFNTHFRSNAAIEWLDAHPDPLVPLGPAPKLLADRESKRVVYCVATAPGYDDQGRLFMAAGSMPRNGCISVYAARDTASGVPLEDVCTLEFGDGEDTLGLAFHPSWPERKLLAASSWSSAVGVFDLGSSPPALLCTYQDSSKEQARGLAWCPGGDFLAVAFTEKEVLVFRPFSDLARGTAWQPSHVLKFPFPCNSVAACEGHLAVGSSDSRVWLLSLDFLEHPPPATWSATKWRQHEFPFPDPKFEVVGLAFAPKPPQQQQLLLAVGGWATAVRILDVHQRKELAVLDLGVKLNRLAFRYRSGRGRPERGYTRVHCARRTG